MEITKENKNLNVNPKNSLDIRLDESWRVLLNEELQKPYIKDLKKYLFEQKKLKKIIYPTDSQIFNALNLTPFKKVKLVILGQDPYHGPGQAHGLSFSVPKGVRPPPSLVNIYKELIRDLKLTKPSHGDLTQWAEQGVLLLNATLTVEASMAGSHQKKGWEYFTDKIIELLNEHGENLVFMLWGAFAQKKGSIIDSKKHLVLKSVHPSPLSAHRGFIGNNHFSMANKYLKAHNKKPIDWNIL